MFKVNNKDTRTAPTGVVLVSLLLTLSRQMLAGVSFDSSEEDPVSSIIKKKKMKTTQVLS